MGGVTSATTGTTGCVSGLTQSRQRIKIGFVLVVWQRNRDCSWIVMLPSIQNRDGNRNLGRDAYKGSKVLISYILVLCIHIVLCINIVLCIYIVLFIHIRTFHKIIFIKLWFIFPSIDTPNASEIEYCGLEPQHK